MREAIGPGIAESQSDDAIMQIQKQHTTKSADVMDASSSMQFSQIIAVRGSQGQQSSTRHTALAAHPQDKDKRS